MTSDAREEAWSSGVLQKRALWQPIRKEAFRACGCQEPRGAGACFRCRRPQKELPPEPLEGTMANCERTFIAIKPDGVQRSLVGEIIKRFEQKGFRLVAMKLIQVWEGLNVVKTGRVMLGETNPADSKPGTIRGDFCIQVGRNIIHGSDSVESAEKEIGLWFQPEELVDYKSCAQSWIYE
ncbi:nucleoside diphosphate kinase A-like [Mustela nigripes]|uniref:nucleoside diphosphate kinase A-like n=1 Tax=Mustela nigripes TaxID=77151 RepID=UPI002815F366|nr:nucleoside diphosphate kinase A-like [Mustela nigripes]